MKRISGIIALLLLAIGLGSCGGSDSVISAEEAKERMDSGDSVTVVDVRSQEEFEEEHIQGAINVPDTLIAQGKSEEYLPDKEAEILVYCRSGNRSAQATSDLLDQGYTNVKDFGGIKDWPYETVKGKEGDKSKKTGNVFGDFKSTDLKGQPVDFSVFSEKKLTMVNIWATFCTPCLDEMPDLSKLNKEYAHEGFQVVGIPVDVMDGKGNNSKEMIRTAEKAVKNTGAAYLHILPSDSLYERLSQVYSVPETIFVDEKGNQVGESYIGSRSKKEWSEIIEKLLKEV